MPAFLSRTEAAPANFSGGPCLRHRSGWHHSVIGTALPISLYARDWVQYVLGVVVRLGPLGLVLVRAFDLTVGGIVRTQADPTREQIFIARLNLSWRGNDSFR